MFSVVLEALMSKAFWDGALNCATLLLAIVTSWFPNSHDNCLEQRDCAIDFT